MATAGMHNLNAPAAQPGPLTAAEVDRYRQLHRVCVPDSTAPRIPRQRSVDVWPLVGLLILAASAVGVAWAFVQVVLS